MTTGNERQDNGWSEWSKYVLKELERMHDWLNEIEKKVNSQRVEIAMLQVKAGLWGALGGIIPLLVLLGLRLLSK